MKQVSYPIIPNLNLQTKVRREVVGIVVFRVLTGERTDVAGASKERHTASVGPLPVIITRNSASAFARAAEVRAAARTDVRTAGVPSVEVPADAIDVPCSDAAAVDAGGWTQRRRRRKHLLQNGLK